MGALFGAVSGGISAANSGNASPQSIAAGILGGALGGAAAGASFGTGSLFALTTIGASAAGGAIGSTAGQLASGTSFECLDRQQIVTQAVVGGLSGAYGGSLVFNTGITMAQRTVGSAAVTGIFGFGINFPLSSDVGGFGPSKGVPDMSCKCQ